MGQEKHELHPDPPEKIWLFEQADGRWMSWSGGEQALREFLDGTDIFAYEFALTGRAINKDV